MNKLFARARRSVFASAALLLGLALTLPSLFGGVALAVGGQVASRSITMSSSAASATGVSYTIKFTPATTEASGDVFVDFCANTPLVSDSCTATAGTDTPDVSTLNTTPTGACTAAAAVTGNHAIRLTGCTITSGSALTVTVAGIKNPTNVGATNGSFYGRILTYATNGSSAVTTSQTPGAYVDYGGIALSTANNITITAKVFETLSFCLFQGTNCGSGSAPGLTLGDSTTGALSTSTAYLNSNAKYTLATNAAGGLSVVMRGTTLCRSSTPSDCDTGSASPFTITAQKPAAGSFATPGSEQFGMCVDVVGSSLTAVAPYADTTGTACDGLATGTYAGSSTFGFDDDTASGGTNNAAGSQVLSSSGAVTSHTGNFVFAANIANTTEAGIYTTSLNLVATSTF